ncbi:MAG: SDR family NAD(P)-dependent oxidoreductase, partial [Phaeodactylibacter sp.]|nr:SDR family NAD(P)-dependent oxidoreductase [Phaeodactylibacter sp.]
MPYHNKSIVITGGSSGIGLAIATALARHQNRLILLARNTEHLEAAAEQLRAQGNSEVHIYPVDISDRPYCTAVITQIGATHGIDLLINNAGISHCRYFDNITVDDFDQITQINYLGALYCTKAAWPFLKAAEPGRIVFVSSVAGCVGLIGYSSYVPTKFALTGLAESLRMEGQRFG